MTVVVNTLQGKTRWATPHIGKESRVAIAPAVADSDVARAVVGEIFSIRVSAAVLHVCPDPIFAATAKSLPVPFPDAATAAQAVAPGQIAFLDKDGVAAVASTPIALAHSRSRRAKAGAALSRLWGAALDDLQQPEALAEDLDVFGHTVKGTPTMMVGA